MKKQFAVAGLIAMTLATLVLPAMARPWHHPRVHQVNARRGNQHNRIQQGVRSGSLTKTEAQTLRQEGQAIHAQERAMRAQDGGHLTKQDRRTLNSELNQRSQEIYQDKHN